ncbi:MAG: helix-turn-helix domain-containing protein [Nanoarchaeota archaeon]
MDKGILRAAGFTEYEVEVYLALLQYGSLTAYELADKAGLYRQATYDALHRLLEKGYVSTVKEGKTQLYNSLSPELVLEYLQEKTEQFKHILPELQQLQTRSQEKLVVETYKGKNVTRIALRDIIHCLKKTGGEVLATINNESIALEEYGTTTEQYERDLLAYKIKERVIIQEGARGLLKKGTTTYRTLPEKYTNQHPVQIYGNNVQILIWGNPDYLMIIRSKDVAEGYRKQFELLWKNAKEEK